MKSGGFTFAMLGALWSCAEAPDLTLGAPVAHPNGLEVAVPEGYDAVQRPDGFVLNEGGALRSPQRIELRLTGTEADASLDRTYRLDGAVLPYKLQALGGGSGGTEYELTAVRGLGDTTLWLVARQQSELGAPDFALAWAVLGAATYTPAPQ